jgi:hypothetical protein
MSTITARDAQVFVAGAFASHGLYALLYLPHTVAISLSPIFPIIGAMGALTLPLGIAILIRNIFAVRVAYVYLWLNLLFGCAVWVLLFSTPRLRALQSSLRRDAAITTAGQAILLALLFWSRRRRRLDGETGAEPDDAVSR